MATEADEVRSLLARIEEALDLAADIFDRYDQSAVSEVRKDGGDPVTEVDFAIDTALHETLVRASEGWLSEETADDQGRRDAHLTWVVDPLDGTREFVDGLPEFCTSIAAVVDGEPIAGGVLNPAAGIRVVGASGAGLTVRTATKHALADISSKRVLASRSEVNRGQWCVVEEAGWTVTPIGSVAYKLARVAAGLDPITWTPVPKHEWDVAGGAALLKAAHGAVLSLELEELVFNKERPWLSGAIAVPAGFEGLGEVHDLIGRQLSNE